MGGAEEVTCYLYESASQRSAVTGRLSSSFIRRKRMIVRGGERLFRNNFGRFSGVKYPHKEPMYTKCLVKKAEIFGILNVIFS